MSKEAPGEPASTNAPHARAQARTNPAPADSSAEREAFLNALIAAAPIGIQVFGPDGTSERMNEASRAIFQLPTRDVGVGAYNALTDPFSISNGSAALFERAYKGESIEAEELTIDFGAADNHWETVRQRRTLEVSLFPIPGAGEAIRAVIAFVRDVTEARRDERTVRRGRDLFRAILEAMGDALILSDAQGKTVLQNPAVTRMFGPEVDPDAMLFRDQYGMEVFHADGVTPLSREAGPAARALAGEIIDDMEIAARKLGTSELRHFTLNARRLELATGEVEGSVIVVHEITGRRLAAEAVHIAQTRLATVVNNAPFILAVIDADGTLRMLEGRGLREAGIDPAGMIGQPYSEALPDVGETYANIRRALAGEEFSDVLTGPLTGRTQQVNYSSLRNDAGEVVSVHMVALDVTDRMAADAALQQAEKLESLSVLAGGIAHDFNNLLVGIMGNAELALMDLESGTPAHEAVAAISKAGKRAAELSLQMLAYSGRNQFFAIPVGLNDLVQEVAQRTDGPMRIILSLDERLAPILADPAQLRLAVVALVTNAVEANDEHGPVELTTSTVPCTAELFARCHLSPDLSEGAYACLEVRDHGPGISPDARPRVFDPFFSTKFVGRGLGLAAVSGIVRGLNGAIEVQSEPGEGATFRVYLPFA